MKIVDEIKNGEGKTLEFKEVFPAADKISKTVCSFSNMAGGKIIIGVNNNRELVGINEIDIPEQMDRISNIIHDTVHPNIVPEIYTYNIDGKTLLIVEVFPSHIKPHFLKSKGKLEGTFIRVGATNKKADNEYIQELERQRLNISFDEDISIQEVKESEINDLKTLLKKNLDREIKREDLINLKLMRENNNNIRLTNGAYILLGNLEYVQIKCARFKGDSMDIFIDRKEFNGNIFTQLEESMKFLLANINLEGRIGEDFITRVDEYEIPPEALREAVVNAIVHRDYSITGSDIKIAVFDSKIEITSPGCFPKGITIDEVLGGRSEIRNKVIVRIFREAKKIEQWGRGVRMIIDLCTKHGLKKPEILEKGMFVKYIFYRKQDEKVERKSRTKKQDVKTGRKNRTEKQEVKSKSILYEQKIKEYLEQNMEINITKAMEILKLSKSRTNIILKGMIDKELIRKNGKGRATIYINKSNS